MFVELTTGVNNGRLVAIVTIEDVDISCLTYEDGKPIVKEDLENRVKCRQHDMKFRYSKAVDLKECKIELLNEDLFKKIIEESENIVFFGGAGVSTESGIPDFRSKDGLYNQKYKYPPDCVPLPAKYNSRANWPA